MTWTRIRALTRTPPLLLAQALLRCVPLRPIDVGKLCFLQLNGLPTVPAAMLRGDADVRFATLDDLDALARLQDRRPLLRRRFADGDRTSAGGPHRHQVFELPEIAVRVSEHRAYALRCRDCGKRPRASPPARAHRSTMSFSATPSTACTAAAMAMLAAVPRTPIRAHADGLPGSIADARATSATPRMATPRNCPR